jgi:cell division protein FtsI/penicillin-binding protein 2
VALAELIGILVNDGVRKRSVSLNKIHFARSTPYETLLEQKPQTGVQVLQPEVARAVRKAMAEVVERGTARRLNGVFRRSDGLLLTVGGKTGSGDNKFETFNRYGGVISSRATNRTAAFVFYISDRYFGVITAYVQGREAADYRFTSALPVTLMKILAPTLMASFDTTTAPPSADLETGIKGKSTPHKINFDGVSRPPAPVSVSH